MVKNISSPKTKKILKSLETTSKYCSRSLSQTDMWYKWAPSSYTYLCKYAAVLDLTPTQLLHHIFSTFCNGQLDVHVVHKFSHPLL